MSIADVDQGSSLDDMPDVAATRDEFNHDGRRALRDALPA